MNRFTVGKEYDAQISIFHLRNLHPATNPSIGLDLLSRRRSNGTCDPFIANDGSVGALTHDREVSRHLHSANIARPCEPSMR
ncbi:MAG: hypothetical protein KGJ25_14930, partial [Betaproteobacteria bacterium]|nr:hypothetical protein [Betaproteobacteria bacterium]